jgi:hypothetical protein
MEGGVIMRIVRLWYGAAAALLVGCGPAPTQGNTPVQATCAIADVAMPGAGSDYNKAATATTVDQLAEAARADRDALKGDPGRLGTRLSELNRSASRVAFVAAPVVELATRLRQLDCAMLRSPSALRPEEADKRYQQIIAEIEDQRGKLSAASRASR